MLDIVDERNPAPVDIENIPWFIRFHISWCRISSINSININKEILLSEAMIFFGWELSRKSQISTDSSGAEVTWERGIILYGFQLSCILRYHHKILMILVKRYTVYPDTQCFSCDDV